MIWDLLRRALPFIMLWMAICVFLLLFTSLAYSHDWYEKDCCDQRDCVPVTKTEFRPDGTTIFHTKKFGLVKVEADKWGMLARINRLRPSRDSGFHVCVVTFSGDLHDEGISSDKYVRCIYAPGGY